MPGSWRVCSQPGAGGEMQPRWRRLGSLAKIWRLKLCEISKAGLGEETSAISVIARI